MGQFIAYITSMFGAGGDGKQVEGQEKTNHVTFADNSFTQAFNRSSIEQANKLEALRQANNKTIRTFQFVVFVVALLQAYMVLIPKTQHDSFAISEPEGWQLVTLNLMPIVIQVASICAMAEINKPLPEGAKLTAKHSALELDNNDFIHSLKLIIMLMAGCQVAAIFFELSLWGVIMIVPYLFYQFTSKLAQNEFDRHAPTCKRSVLNKLNLGKSPKMTTPSKPAQPASAKKDDAQAHATPRTRTKRAVRNLMTGVSDKYHAFEQNVAHQLSQKIFTPLSPKAKMIET